MGVQFGDEIDMNNNKIRELADGTDPTDAVTVSQLTANAPQGFAQDIGNGVAVTYTVAHNLNTLDVIVRVYNKTSNEDVTVGVDRVDVDNVSVTFTVPPLLNSHRVLVIPVP